MDHTFTLLAPSLPAVACRCSAWGGTPRPMTRIDAGRWALTADLPPGTHAYGFVCTSLSWFSPGELVDVPDPYARELSTDERESLITVPTPPALQAYPWRHDAHPLPGHAQLVIYELHVADFASDGKGTFAQVAERIGEIADLGFTALELLPVGAADQRKGWGYTPRFFFAVEPRYGSETDLCRLVDTAHGCGLAVIIDGVYNHASPECPLTRIDHDCYFHHAPKDPDQAWGPQFDYGRILPGTDEYPARHFIKEKVAHWIGRFHLDGIRYDAISQFRDRPFLGELTAWAREKAGVKPFFALAECIPLELGLVGPHGPMDAWWRAEFAIRVRGLLAGTWNAAELKSCYNCRRDGYPCGLDVVNYLASHDLGHTVRHLLDAGLDEAAALYRMQLGLTILFTAPGVPMVWMGDEVGCALPASQEPQPIDWAAAAADPRRIALRDLTRRLLRTRAAYPVLTRDDSRFLVADDQERLLVVQRGDGDQAVLVVLHGGDGDRRLQVPQPAAGTWRELSTGQTQQVARDAPLAFTLGGWQAQVWLRE